MNEMKFIPLVLFLMALSAQAFAKANSSGYPVPEGEVVYDVANFAEGVDSSWNPSIGPYAPRFWTTGGPVYNYVPGNTGRIMAMTTPSAAACNYWDVFGERDGITGYTGYADMDYQLFIPTSDKLFPWEKWSANYQDWRGYSKLRIQWSARNSDPRKRVLLEVFVHTQADGGKWLQISPLLNKTQIGMHTDTFSLSGLTPVQLSAISSIKFRTPNNFIAPGKGKKSGWQRTFLYDIKLIGSCSSAPPAIIGDQQVTSHFLGTVLHRRYGSYSASGFYDTDAGKSGMFKIWFGGGIPEKPAGDNVWFVQTPSLDSAYLEKTDLKSVRCTVTPINLWVQQYKGVDQTWGDPSVVRLRSSRTPHASEYVMYVSAVADGTNWNQIYRLTSKNGINWTIDPQSPVVKAKNGGVAGYGSGSPSVLILDGRWWMYYYSQSEPEGPGVYLRKSTDGVAWGDAFKTSDNVSSAVDVKYIDALKEFVAVSDVEAKGGGVYTLVSQDGVRWSGGAPPYLSEDANAYLCHNPGFIGTDRGHGFPDMYVTYGASQEPFGPTEYYTRELEYSSWHIGRGK